MNGHPDATVLLKVAIPSAGGAEHMWMRLERLDARRVSGWLVNDGVDVPYHYGDHYETAREQTSDWMVQCPPEDSGPIFGGYTLRVIVARDPSLVPPGFSERLQPLPE